MGFIGYSDLIATGNFIHSVDFGSDTNFSLFCCNLGEDRETECRGERKAAFSDG